MVNEVLVGFSNTHVINNTVDPAGIGDANAKYNIAGGQPIPGLSQIGWGGGLTLPGAIAPDSDTLAKTYQINEKLTWLRGRHGLKFGGQMLHYNQRRFYAGNNGLLGSITYSGMFTGQRSPTSCSIRSASRDVAVATLTILDPPSEPHLGLRAG